MIPAEPDKVADLADLFASWKAADIEDKYKFRMAMLIKTVWMDPAKFAVLARYPTEVLKCEGIIEEASKMRVVADVEDYGMFHMPLPKAPTTVLPQKVKDADYVKLGEHIIRCCADGCHPK